MCQYKLLSGSSCGSTSRCKGCGTHKVNFNNIIIKFDQHAFPNFKESLEDCHS